MKKLYMLGLVAALTVVSHNALALKPISAAEFDNIISSNKMVVVDFYADWCGPCKGMKATLSEVEGSYSDILFGTVNIDRANSLANEFGVRSIPTVILFKDGKKFSQWTGSKPKSFVITEINKLMGKKTRAE